MGSVLGSRARLASIKAHYDPASARVWAFYPMSHGFGSSSGDKRMMGLKWPSRSSTCEA